MNIYSIRVVGHDDHLDAPTQLSVVVEFGSEVVVGKEFMSAFRVDLRGLLRLRTMFYAGGTDLFDRVEGELQAEGDGLIRVCRLGKEANVAFVEPVIPSCS